jgi:hypothetical protein
MITNILRKKHEVILFLITLTCFFVSIYTWYGGIAGDAVIHMIFAENASNGSWFSFNPGNSSGGETSPIYMLWLTLIYLIFEMKQIPYVIQFLSIAIYTFTLLIFFKITLDLSKNNFCSYTMVLCFGLMPGTSRNALMGMENIYAALFILVLIYLIIKFKFFEKINSFKLEFIFSALSGLAMCLRPDTIILIFFIYFIRIISFLKSDLKFLIYIFLSGLFALAVYFLSLLLYFNLSDGFFPFSGGIARSQLSLISGIEIFGLNINLQLVTRWFCYFPILISFIYCSSLLFGKIQFNLNFFKNNNNLVLGVVLILSIIVYIILYTFLFFPSVHLSRYLIYYWFLVSIFITIMIFGSNKYYYIIERFKKIFFFLIICMIVINIAELFVRYKILSPGHKLKELANAPNERKMITDNLLESINNEKGNIFPIKVALIEVQMKYWWDNRIFVISLDGILDKRLLNYFENGNYDHFTYLLDNQVNYIFAFPNLNQDKTKQSLKDLENFKDGYIGRIKNLKFRKISHNIVQILY